MSFPQPAQACVDHIEALLDEAERCGLDRADGSEDAFALRETRARYLPETLATYERVPSSARAVADPASGKSPDDLLVEQLTILERATAQRLMRLAESARCALSANGRFLAQRLGSAESLPEVPATVSAAQEPHLLARRFVERLGGGVRNRDLVNAVATRLYEAFPLLTRVDRGIFGSGAARRVEITVPIENDRLRYALVLGPQGNVEATCAKIVRGVTIRSTNVGLDEWVRGLFTDLSAYAHASASTQERLASLVR